MKKGNTLPESLELLLDTMCNTFGGIVFIAISLTIISQMAVKNMVPQEEETEEDPKKNIQEIKQEINGLEETLIRKMKEADRKKTNRREDHSLTWQHMQQELNERQRRLKLMERKIQENETIRRTITQRLDNNRKQLKQLKQQNATRSNTDKQEEQNLMAKKKILTEKLEKLQQETRRSHGQVLAFTQQKSTQKSPFWVFIKERKLYRYYHGRDLPDMRMTITGNEMNFDFIHGYRVGEDSHALLNQLFSMADAQEQFISIIADPQSFQELVITRRFLRSSGYLVQWTISDVFKLYRSSHISYTAGD